MKKNYFSRFFEVAIMVLALSLIVNSIGFAEKQDIGSKVNINKATVKELSAVKGIGKKKAMAIIVHREKKGVYENVGGIQKVKGIGKKTFEKIKDSLTVDDG